ncbi:MAG TPA: SRPBCC family protein, partial [Candidatus Acidoferrum sp.]|nr:SRPBCC family protein [Candidatus Acidoferrum sp.]
MTELGTIVDATAVRFERLLPGPIERVWAYLTESKRLATWLGSGTIELRPGGEVRFELIDHPRELGNVVRCERPALLSYTWSGESLVTFGLAARGGWVLLTLTHEHLPTEDLTSIAAGWHALLEGLAAQLNGDE